MKWIFLKLLVVLALSFSVPCYSLSPEEKADLPTLSKEELIEIILIYDQTLDQIESENLKKISLLNEREIDLNKREERASEREASFQMRESLLVESLKIRKELEKTKFWQGFGYGSLSGFVFGNISGGLVVSQFN
jgi:hypothetical protein